MMSDNSCNSIVAEMKLPSVGGRWTTVWYAFIWGFVATAIWHLLNCRSVEWTTFVASCLWLILVFAVCRNSCHEDGGLSQYFINRLGEFGAARFLTVERTEIGESEACFGYWLHGKRYYFFKVPLSEIVSLNWNTGQATSLAGRDMNDWHTCIWHLTNRDTMASKITVRDRGRREDFYLFGPQGTKETVEPFACRTVKFLSDSGAVLRATAKEHEFANPALQTEHSHESKKTSNGDDS